VVGPGFVIGRWRLERPLGDGGTSSVWLAVNRSNEAERAAVKLVRWDQSPNAAARFRAEARILQGLRHPNIVAFRQAGVLEDQGLMYLVMDSVEGEHLGSVFRRGAQPADWVRVVFGQIASALDHVHVQGITHRDLKPENVMVRPDGSPCVIDFGIALEEGRERVTREGMLPGTMSYMPPEVFRHGVQLDARKADIYAFGVMLYEALSGVEAFPAPSGLGATQQTAHVVARKLERGPLRVEVAAPNDIAEVVAIATHPDPTLRFASMRLVAERLGSGGGHGSAPTRPRASQAPGTVWFDDDDEDDQPFQNRPSSGARFAGPIPTTNTARSNPEGYRPPPGKWGEAPETTFGEPRPTREDVLEALRAPAPPSIFGSSADVGTPPPPAPPIAPPPVIQPVVSPVVATAPATEPDDAYDEDGRTNAEALRIIVGVAAGVVFALLAGAGLAYAIWPSAEVPVERTVKLQVDGEAGDVRIDGLSVAVSGGMVETALEFGTHAITLASAADCIDENGTCDDCCRCETKTIEVEPGDGAQEVWVEVPAAPAAERKVAVQLDGVEGLDMPVGVSVGDQHLNVGRDGLFTTKPLPRGSYDVRVDVGACAEEEGGCLQEGDCPEGCYSWAGSATVACGEGDVHFPIALDVDKAEEPEATPTPTPTPRVGRTGGGSSRKTPDPDEPAVPLEEPKPEPYVFVSSEVVRGSLDANSLQAAMRGLRYRMKSCYAQLLESEPNAAGRVVIDFKVQKDGAVSKSGFAQRSGSGSARLDACATGAVQTARVADAKPGAAGVMVTFEVR
jgi:serine/threonine protein kinase